MKSKKGFVIPGALILLMVIGIGLVLFAGSDSPLAISSQSNYVPPYPSDRSIVAQVKGFMRAELTGGSFIGDTAQFAKCTEAVCGEEFDKILFSKQKGTYVYYKYVECPQEAGSQGCELELDYIRCSQGTPSMKQGEYGGWFDVWDGYLHKMSAGSGPTYVATTCRFNNVNYAMYYWPRYKIKYPECGIYILGSDYAEQGLLRGSTPDCSWVSSDYASRLIEMQEKGRDFEIGSKLALGRTISLTVGWREVPSVGNINPMGQYSGNDVLCRATTNGAEIKRINEVTTQGGRTFYMEGSVLDSGRSYCCGNAQCSGDSVCEDYECKFTAPTCELGQCNFWQKGDIISKDVCENRLGNRVLVTQGCDQNACVYESTKDVACCPEDCSKDYVCDYNEGCVRLQIKNECPDRQCCKEGHVDYKPSGCGLGFDCCLNEFETDPLRGLCLSQCTVANENCKNGVDDDGDGKTDMEDDECNVCVIDGKNLNLAQDQCCVERGGKWTERVIEPKAWEFWKSATVVGNCRISHFPIAGLILVIVGLLVLIFAPWKIVGIIVTVMGVMWLLLAGIGVI